MVRHCVTLGLMLVAAALACTQHRQQDHNGERVWRAGGTPERAARGKCWIDGDCWEPAQGREWRWSWRGGSSDEDMEGYAAGVGQREDVCVGRAKVWFGRCGNWMLGGLDGRVCTTFVPTGKIKCYPPLSAFISSSSSSSHGNDDDDDDDDGDAYVDNNGAPPSSSSSAAAAAAAAAWAKVVERRKLECWHNRKPQPTRHEASCRLPWLCGKTPGRSLENDVGNSEDGDREAGGEGLRMNALVALRDFDVLEKEVAVLRDLGYCVNQDAIFKWAALLHLVPHTQVFHEAASVAENTGGVVREEREEEGCVAIDVGGGSSPLQFLFSAHCDVVNIDVNFLSSWFPIDRDGVYMRADKAALYKLSSPHRIRQIEGFLLPELKKLKTGSVSLIYDACSLIHMSPGIDPRVGLEAAMTEIVRVLRPGGYFVSVSDVAHPAAAEMREFLHAETLASIYIHHGLMEWASEPEFILQEGQDEDFFGDERTCIKIESAWSKPNMTSHPLSAANVHTCENITEGPLRLLVANFVLRKLEYHEELT